MKNILTLLGLFSAVTASAQDWKEMMYDNSYNFYEVCEAAEKYFETHDKDVKGSGWKGYMRWRDLNESKYAPSGNRSQISPQFAAEQYSNFIENTTVDKTLFGNGWKELGPWQIDSITGHYAVGLGRVEDMYVNPANTDILYLGTRSGGFWRSFDEGATWEGTTDFMFASGVNALTARPTNHQDVLINVQNSGNQYSHGIYRSSDAGATWSQTAFNPSNTGLGGLGSSFRVYDLAYHPSTPDLVFIGTSQGIFRSDDDLVTWTQSLPSALAYEIRFHPTNQNVIYAYDGRSSNGNRNYVFISTDAGLSWTLSAQAVGNSNSRASISVSADCPDCIFFQSGNGVWKSLNQGASFDFVSDPGEGRGAFIVSDTDTSVMVLGSIDPFVTLNGGQSFAQSGWWSLGSSEHGGGTFSENYAQTEVYVHADLRAAQSVNGVLYLGTDGFLCKSVDNGATWEVLSMGTPIRENYTLGVSQSNHYTSMIGSQDNGTSILVEEGWVEYFGADGMEAIIHPLNPDWMIGSYQYGGRVRTYDRGLSSEYIHPSGESGAGEATWVAPMAYNPNDQQQIYHFSAEVWMSEDFGENWVELGTPTTFNGGLIEYAAIAENNSDVIVVSRDKDIERSEDGGLTFTDIQNNLPNNADIKEIAFDPRNDSIMVVVYNRYQNDGNKVFITYDAGQNWTNITYNLGDMPIRCAVIDHSNESNIYLGAEIGVYVMPEAGNTWTLYNTDLPNMTVRELAINYGSNTLRAATWGRGMWEYTLKDRIDYPAIVKTEITNPPTFVHPKEDVDQYVTSVISYDNTPSEVYLEWSVNTPTFGNVIGMSNTMDSTWVSDAPLPNFPEGTKMFFKVFAIGVNGDTTETYKFMYTVQFNAEASLDELSGQSMILFPNPNSGEFTIQLRDVKELAKVTILALDGKTVWQDEFKNSSSLEVNVSLEPATYFVVLEAEGVNVVEKVVIKN